MKQILFIIFLLFVTSACKKSYTVEDIQSDIFVYLQESEGKLYIMAETEFIYGCSGYGISFKEKTKYGVSKISFKKIHVPSFCLFVTEPATCQIDITHLTNTSYTYEIFFYLDKHENRFFLDIVDGEYKLTYIGGKEAEYNVKIKE